MSTPVPGGGDSPRAGLAMLARVAALAAEGTPFALATVTWRRGPSSGKGGSKAVVHTDGTVEGWLGGACAEPTVVRQALEALQDGQPRLLVLGAPDVREGVTTVAMACSSEGAMEVFVEPVLPAPDVWVVGRSPAVRTLAALADTLGWTAHVVSDDIDLSGVGPRSAVVVATQGHYDEPAVEAALATTAAYVGLVASRKRAAAVLAWLRDRGMGEEQLSRLRAPAQGWTSGPLHITRSPWPSSPSWSRCGPCRPRSPRPGGGSAAGVRPCVWHDGGRRDRPVRLRVRRAQGLLLRRGLPEGVRQGQT